MPVRLTLEELEEALPEIHSANEHFHKKLRPVERFVIGATKRLASFYFMIVIFSFTATWFIWNLSVSKPLDVAPQFPIYCMVADVVQLLMFPLLLYGQSLMAKQGEDRADFAYIALLRAESQRRNNAEHSEFQTDMIIKMNERLKNIEVAVGAKAK